MLATLPLSVVQALGATVARIAIPLSKRERERLRENLRTAGYDQPRIRRAAIAESGKMLFELPWLWLRAADDVLRRVRKVEGLRYAEAAQEAGRGIIFLTPHLGCFEVAAQYAASHAPITVMFRPPRQKFLRPLVEAGRMRANIRAVPANTRGATALLAALRKGEWVGILPDQVPKRGEGEWARFFGRWALTMTLPMRLQRRTGAAILLCFCERLPWGRGYSITIEPLPLGEDAEAVQRLNDALEKLIRRKPEQYLWAYDRYATPLGMTPPDDERGRRGETDVDMAATLG